MKYQKIMVIGSGMIACKCIEILKAYTDRIMAIEYKKHPLSTVPYICNKNNFPYRAIESRDELIECFLNITERTLIISANNNFIFPKIIVEKANLKIINFHNALLPNHPGRNAPTWVIYHMEKVTGITWHEIDSGIDTGNIITQKQLPVKNDITALQLTRECMELGSRAFEEILPSILNDDYLCKPQQKLETQTIHYSWDIPNDGVLDITWSIEKISAFLRSLDYGPLEVFPNPTIKILGNEYTILRYNIKKLLEPSEEKLLIMKRRMLFTDKSLSILLENRSIKE